MRDSKSRRWAWIEHDDPAAGLLNLFDVWMVFAIALLLALVSYIRLTESTPRPSATADGARGLEAIDQRSIKVERVRLTDDQLGGEGQRLGTAYRLKSGEIVYVPEATLSEIPPAD